MPIVFGAIAAAGAIGSFASQLMGGEAKKDAMYAGASLTDQQAQFTKEQTAEELRRFELQAGQAVGEAKAKVGASGFASGGVGSMNKYVAAFAGELSKEAAWMKRAGYATADFQHQAANIQRQSADAGLWGDALSASAGLLGNAGHIGQQMFGFGGGSSQAATNYPAWMSNNPMGGASGT